MTKTFTRSEVLTELHAMEMQALKDSRNLAMQIEDLERQQCELQAERKAIARMIDNFDQRSDEALEYWLENNTEHESVSVGPDPVECPHCAAGCCTPYAHVS